MLERKKERMGMQSRVLILLALFLVTLTACGKQAAKEEITQERSSVSAQLETPKISDLAAPALSREEETIDPKIAMLAEEWLPEKAELVKAFRMDQNRVAFGFDVSESLGDASERMGKKLEEKGYSFGVYDSDGGGGKLLKTEENGEEEIVIAVEDQGEYCRVAVIIKEGK